MSIVVIRGGLQTSVQDAGAEGWGRFGVPERGALDVVSLRLANMLIGNPPDAAALEMTLDGPHLLFERAARIAICGAEMPAEAEAHESRAKTASASTAATSTASTSAAATSTASARTAPVTTAIARPVPAWRAVDVGAGTLLRLGRATAGVRAYLAIAGGIDVPVVLGCRSTHLRAGFGGFEGRALAAGDRLAVGDAPIIEIADGAVRPARWTIGPDERTPTDDVQVVRAIASPGAMLDLSSSGEQTVGAAADRMGVRFIESLGPHALAITSEPAMIGAVQLPPDGRPIVLLAEHQTTGGYPVVAHVASVDLPRLGQLRPGSRVRFESIDLESARRLLVRREENLRRLSRWIELQTGS
jgi:antagonist of KipI